MAASELRTQQIIVTSLTVTGGLAVVGAVAGSHPVTARLALGLVATGVMLAALAEFAPGLAFGISVLIMLTAAFVYGLPAWNAIQKGTKS
jgi:hypothetical protein